MRLLHVLKSPTCRSVSLRLRSRGHAEKYLQPNRAIKSAKSYTTVLEGCVLLSPLQASKGTQQTGHVHSPPRVKVQVIANNRGPHSFIDKVAAHNTLVQVHTVFMSDSRSPLPISTRTSVDTNTANSYRVPRLALVSAYVIAANKRIPANKRIVSYC